MAALRHDDLLPMYATYLKERGYQAVKIPETTTRTPDLEVSGHKNSYLNEFKARDLRLDPVISMYKFSTTNSRLWSSIHTAIKQLGTYDPSHAKPWVVTFASVNGHELAARLGTYGDGRVVVGGRRWPATATVKRSLCSQTTMTAG